MDAPVRFLPNFIPAIIADHLFESLLEIEWEQRTDVPRMEYYCNDTPLPYTYGNGVGERTYLPRPYPRAVLAIRSVIEEQYPYLMDVCFLNRYDTNRDALGWHADDSPEMDPNRPVITVTLGASREIEFRLKEDHCVKSGLTLTHGSMAVMLPGMQQTWDHRIPKAGYQTTTRISLTYRGYLNND